VASIPLLLRSFIGLLCQRWMIDGGNCGAINAMHVWQGKTKAGEENRPQGRSVHQTSHMI
jgi:hypothetical protein